MTYSLDTLVSPSRSTPSHQQTGFARFAVEMVLLGGALLLGFWLLAMLSYSTLDAAWSTSGSGVALHNRGGRLGAWVADASYYLFGFSVWWCFAAAVRAWLARMATWLRQEDRKSVV